MKHPSETEAAELIAAGSPHIPDRARQLMTVRCRIGHTLAYWFSSDYYATKAGGDVRVFHTAFSSSLAKRSRLVADLRKPNAGDIARAVVEDVGRGSPYRLADL